jgi:hypothetical protein
MVMLTFPLPGFPNTNILNPRSVTPSYSSLCECRTASLNLLAMESIVSEIVERHGVDENARTCVRSPARRYEQDPSFSMSKGYLPIRLARKKRLWAVALVIVFCEYKYNNKATRNEQLRVGRQQEMTRQISIIHTPSFCFTHTYSISCASRMQGSTSSSSGSETIPYLQFSARDLPVSPSEL